MFDLLLLRIFLKRQLLYPNFKLRTYLSSLPSCSWLKVDVSSGTKIEIIILVSGRKEVHSYPDWRQLWHTNGDGALVKGEGGISPLDNNTVTNVTVQLGATAYLHCHVRSIGDRSMQGSEVSQIFKPSLIQKKNYLVDLKNV